MPCYGEDLVCEERGILNKAEDEQADGTHQKREPGADGTKART